MSLYKLYKAEGPCPTEDFEMGGDKAFFWLEFSKYPCPQNSFTYQRDLVPFQCFPKGGDKVFYQLEFIKYLCPQSCSNLGERPCPFAMFS